jgi:hypothetical protein
MPLGSVSSLPVLMMAQDIILYLYFRLRLGLFQDMGGAFFVEC